jgi:hypothetical protein
MKPTKLIISSMNVVCQVRNQTPNRITRKMFLNMETFIIFAMLDKRILYEVF